jgi:hypothetical protein
MFLKLFHKVQKQGILPNTFYTARITLKRKPGKNASKKERERKL